MRPTQGRSADPGKINRRWRGARAGCVLGRFAFALGALALVLSLATPCMARAVAMDIRLNGHVTRVFTPGARISVTVWALPSSSHTYCLGLASAIDRAGLPVSLGRVTRDRHGVGRVVTVIPPRLFPAEPAGPFLLFVGVCTPIAPDHPFYARTMIRILPASR